MLKFYHLLERNDIRRKRGSFSLSGITKRENGEVSLHPRDRKLFI
jgi:hypothetical protein